MLSLFNARILGKIDLGGGDNTVLIKRTAVPSSTFTLTNADTVNLDNAAGWVLERESMGERIVTVVDPTAFSANRASLAASTRHINRIVLGRRQAVPESSRESSQESAQANSSPRTWAHLFGGNIERASEYLALAWQQDFYGILGGYESTTKNGNHRGWFGGVGKGQMATETNSIETDSTDVFVGIYGRRSHLDWELNGALLLGHASHDDKRSVLDNLVGNETAIADYNSIYLSPSVSLIRHHKLANGRVLRPSALLSWTRARYDGYSERGSTSSNLKLDSRNENIIAAQVQLSLTMASTTSLETELRVGATLRRHNSDRASLRFADGGVASEHEISGDDSISGGYGGINIRYAGKEGLSLISDVEYSSASGGEQGIVGYLGLEYRW